MQVNMQYILFFEIMSLLMSLDTVDSSNLYQHEKNTKFLMFIGEKCLRYFTYTEFTEGNYSKNMRRKFSVQQFWGAWFL